MYVKSHARLLRRWVEFEGQEFHLLEGMATNISPCTGWHSCKCTGGNTHKRTYAHTRTHTRTHLHASARALSCSLSWNIIMHYDANKATFWNTNENNTELDHIYTLKPKCLWSLKAVSRLCPIKLQNTGALSTNKFLSSLGKLTYG